VLVRKEFIFMQEIRNHHSGASSLRTLCEKFVNEYRRPRIKDLEAYRRNVNAVLRQRVLRYGIADRTVTELRAADIDTLRDELAAIGYQNGSINQTLKVLSTIFTWGQRVGHIEQRNPLDLVERMPETGSIEGYSFSQIRSLLGREDCPAMVATAIYTGMRKGELYGLTWDCVRFDDLRIDVRRSYKTTPKSGKPRIIPLHPQLQRHLWKWRTLCPKTPCDLVFPVRSGHGFSMGRSDDNGELPAFLRAARIAMPQRPWHAFRHSFATLLCESGAQRDAIEQLLGHTPSGSPITSRYIHLSLTFLRRELLKLRLDGKA
jgi:integrase